MGYFFLLYLYITGFPRLIADIFKSKRYLAFVTAVTLALTFPVWIVVPVVVKTVLLLTTRNILSVQADGLDHHYYTN